MRYALAILNVKCWHKAEAPTCCGGRPMKMKNGMHDNLVGILPIKLVQTHAGALLNALHRRWNTCCARAYIGLTFALFACPSNSCQSILVSRSSQLEGARYVVE